MRLLISALALFGFSVSAFALTDKQEGVLNNLANAMAADAACSTLQLNTEFARLASRFHDVDLDDPAIDAELQRRIASAAKKLNGETEDTLCRAGLAYFGPEGTTVPNLLLEAQGAAAQTAQAEPPASPDPITPAQQAAAKAASAAKARSAMIPGFSLQQIQQLLRDAGYRAEMEKDNTGDYIRSGAHGLNIFISTYDCLEDNTECRTLRIETGTFKPDPPVSLEALNEWSRDIATGWAVPIMASDGSYFLLMKISTTGGVTDEWLMNNLAIFADAMSKYHKLLFPS